MKSLARIMLAVTLVAAVSSAGVAQTSEKSKRSEAILKKARQLDLLNFLLPLTLTKSQINTLLIPVEKCRQRVKDIESHEADDLIKLEAKVNTAVVDGADNGKVPGRDILVELSKLLDAFRLRRMVAAGENADLVFAEIKKTWNKGQLAIAAKSIDMKAYDPTLDPSTVSEDDKIKFFIKDVLLDPQSYDVLVRMAKRAS